MASRPPLRERIRRYFDAQAKSQAAREESQELRTERQARARWEAFQLVKASGVESHFAKADLRNLRAELPAQFRQLAARLRNLLAEPELIAVVGDRGRGKTWLGCALVHAFCHAQKPALYRRTKQFFDELSTAEWEAKEAVRRRYVAPALLVLDEVQVRDADRQWQDNELTSLIDRRYAADKATLLISNFSAEMLGNNLGESVTRRLTEGGGIWETPWGQIEELLKGGGRAHQP